MFRSASLRLLLLLSAAAVACAQDPFEIHVYEYEPMGRGVFTYEAHLNYGVKGTTQFEGTVAPMRHQLHFTSEVTAGLNDEFAVGVMLLSAVRPDHTIEYGGWRILPHFYAPRSWHLPVDVGLVTELSFQNTTFEENSRRVEIRPIIEKHIGRLQLTGNPVLERALHGPGVGQGWGFEPAGRVAWEASKVFTPSVEYYSSWREKVHQFSPGGDLKLRDRLTWSFGVGLGATGHGSRLIAKSRFEWSFGRREP